MRWAIKNLILANIAVFFIQMFIAPDLNGALIWLLPEMYYNAIHNSYITAFELVFGLVPSLFIAKFYIWQIVTYMFLHGYFWHIFLNMCFLWYFGRKLEDTWGTREFVRYYFFTGVAAGFCILLWNFGSMIPGIGASGAIFGILVAYVLFFPDSYLFLHIKAKYFVVFMGILEFMALPAQDNISHIAHLGGMVAGFFYIKNRYRHLGIGQNFFRNFFKKSELGKKTEDIPEPEEKFEPDVLDRLLNKVSQKGYESLTPEEKELLKKLSPNKDKNSNNEKK
jgi:membrane associated rhomboid family serine protease